MCPSFMPVAMANTLTENNTEEGIHLTENYSL